jgi:hypothetical protein
MRRFIGILGATMLFGGTLWFTSCTDWLLAFASTLLQNTWVGLLGRTNEFFQAIGFYIFLFFFYCGFGCYALAFAYIWPFLSLDMGLGLKERAVVVEYSILLPILPKNLGSRHAVC